ncbi:MAG TPA: hypothetical protein DD490_21630 [Acidobacteria bacterium]|nr:hypothetical protein [Acidobacteriota bacterium]
MTRPIKRAFFASSIFALLASASLAIELPQLLTAEEVECDRQQLERLALRAAVSEINPLPLGTTVNPTLLLWRLPFGGSAFAGLAVTDSVRTLGNDPLRDELQLSIDITLSEVADRLSPRQPLLPHMALVRRGVDSNLIVPGAKPTLTVSFEAALEVLDPNLPAIPLVVNNLGWAKGNQQPLTAADALGRGLALDGLTRSCHAKLNSFDERVFRVLSRSLRISDWFAGRYFDRVNWVIVLFRGEDPHQYRATIYPLENACSDGSCEFGRLNPVELSFTINWDAAGRLTTGDVRVSVPEETRQIAMFLLPPMRTGQTPQGSAEFEGAPFLLYRFRDSPLNILTATVDWEALLANTAWND